MYGSKLVLHNTLATPYSANSSQLHFSVCNILNSPSFLLQRHLTPNPASDMTQIGSFLSSSLPSSSGVTRIALHFSGFLHWFPHHPVPTSTPHLAPIRTIQHLRNNSLTDRQHLQLRDAITALYSHRQRPLPWTSPLPSS